MSFAYEMARADGPLIVNDLQLEVRRSDQRRTLEIIVDRNGELIIAAPEEAPLHSLADFVYEKRFWIYTKLAEKEELRHTVARKEYVTGEGFSYLGRSYRLLLADDDDPHVDGQEPLKLIAGRFRLLKSEAHNGRNHFIRWYRQRGRQWIKRRLQDWEPRLDASVKEIVVRELGFRWGSCARDGTVYFHWATMLLPPDIVEYVLVHELIHLHEPNHTPEFWLRMERAMPDYEQRKNWLAKHGGKYVVL